MTANAPSANVTADIQMLLAACALQLQAEPGLAAGLLDEHFGARREQLLRAGITTAASLLPRDTDRTETLTDLAAALEDLHVDADVAARLALETGRAMDRTPVGPLETTGADAATIVALVALVATAAADRAGTEPLEHVQRLCATYARFGHSRAR